MKRMNVPTFLTTALLPAVALTGALSLGALGCNPESEAAPKESAKALEPLAVETTEVSAQRFVQTFEFPGVAEPIEQRRIAAEAGGRVLAAPFEEGDAVEKGDLLLRVDADNTNAQIDLIESQLASARREYNRSKRLAKEGLVTPQQLDQATSQLEQARLSLKQAKVGKSKSVVRSPFSGTVAAKFTEPGEFTGPGQPIIDLIDTSTIQMNVTVPESAIPYISKGDEVDVVFPSVGRRVTGTIHRRGVRVAQPTQTFPVEVHISNETGEILPGMRARVIIPKLTLEDAVVVPRDAILEGVNRREAMVVKDLEDSVGEAALRIVTLGGSRGNAVVVTDGLEVGDKLIVVGHRNVVDGAPVRVVRDRTEPKQASAEPLDGKDTAQRAQEETSEAN